MSDSRTTGAQRLPAPEPIAPGPAGRPPVGQFERRGSAAARTVRAQFRATVRERRLGERLVRSLDGVGFVLHHRSVVDGAAPVDHLVVGPTGVWVVQAVHGSGRVIVDASQRTVRMGSSDPVVIVPLMDESDATITGVVDALDGVGYDWAQVRPTACVTSASLRRERRVDATLVTTPRRLVTAVLGRGQLAPVDVQTVAAVLHARFPPV